MNARDTKTPLEVGILTSRILESRIGVSILSGRYNNILTTGIYKPPIALLTIIAYLRTLTVSS